MESHYRIPWTSGGSPPCRSRTGSTRHPRILEHTSEPRDLHTAQHSYNDVHPTEYKEPSRSGLSLCVFTSKPLSILHSVILLSGSIATVAKKDTYIPSRRTGKGPLGAKVFSYYTQDERRLIEKAAKVEHRSLSSFVAIAAVERAQRVLGRN